MAQNTKQTSAKVASKAARILNVTPLHPVDLEPDGDLEGSEMPDNITVRQDPAGDSKPDKQNSTEKIDGIVALIMVLGRGNQKRQRRAYRIRLRRTRLAVYLVYAGNNQGRTPTHVGVVGRRGDVLIEVAAGRSGSRGRVGAPRNKDQSWLVKHVKESFREVKETGATKE